ncbi:hypothetical protein F4604DRAFT_1690821 [Suillus subluteus]|nr:hypothetical protein F4604DRAFT_1690821 [Suillus subluteus]
MSEPIDRRVRFDVPMDTDDESQSSHVSDTPKCGTCLTCIGAQVIKLWLDAARGVSRPYGASNNTVQLWHGCTCHIAVNSIHPSNAVTKANQFWLGLPSSSGVAYASIPINFGWDCLPPLASLMQAPPTTATVDLPTPRLTQLNFGWTGKASSKEAPQHVGYDMTNKPFQFGCEGKPAKVGGWKLVPITATVSADSPATCSSLPVSYAAPALPNMVGALQLPKAPIPAIAVATAGESQEPKPATLVSEAEQAVINIVKHLRSDEFDALAQSLISTVVGPEIEVHNPTNEEVLDSNHVLLTAYSETRDRLTRIFKDLIGLHKIADGHSQVVPAVKSLANEVEKAETRSTGAPQ